MEKGVENKIAVKRDVMNSKEFEKWIANGLCPFCRRKLEYYDGCIGYSALKCPDKKDCGFLADHAGYHIERQG